MTMGDLGRVVKRDAGSTHRDEAAFRDAWLALPDPAHLARLAFEGGALADRLSFVFIAAYQAAVRAAFPALDTDGWVTFAISEDRTGAFAGTSLADGKLNGTKTWLAAADHVDEIIVSIGLDVRQCYLVPRAMDGVSIESYPESAFLAGMSQGRATFDGVAVDALQRLSLTTDFAREEAFHVTCAAAGFLAREFHVADEGERYEESLAQGAALMSMTSASDDLPAVYERVKALGKSCGVISREKRAADWQANGRLLGMYGARLRTV